MVDASKIVTQRAYMRVLAKKYGKKNRTAIVREFTKALAVGKVIRVRNKNKTSDEAYSHQMWHLMNNHGW